VPLLIAALGAFTVSLDSAVNIAFPDMAAAFARDPASIRWVIICYVFTYALTAFGAGLAADRLGPAAVFIAGAWISAACFIAYLMPLSFAGILALRVAQGVGGGFIYGTAPALVTLSSAPERHGRGLGLMSLGLALGLAVGPPVGGLLVERFGWRAVFLFRAPVALVLGALAVWGLVPNMPAAASATRAAGGFRAALAARWPVVSALLLAFLANYAQFAVWLLVPFYLVGVLGLPGAVGGLLFMLTPLGAAVAAPVGGWATDRWGPGWPVVAGLGVETLGLLGISRFTAETPWPVVAIGLALVGLGLGVFQVPNLVQVMTQFPPAAHGGAGGLAFMSRTLGIVSGVQAAALLFGWALPGRGFAAAFALAFTGAAAVCALATAVALVSRPRRAHLQGVIRG
jgi:MFS family permease